MGAACSCLAADGGAAAGGGPSGSAPDSPCHAPSARAIIGGGGGAPVGGKKVAPELAPEVAAALAAAAADLERSHKLPPFKERYALLRIIGHGAYSKVYEACHVASGASLAVKVLTKTSGEEGEAQRVAVVREVAIMRRLAGHPGSLRLVEAAESASNYYIAMELCSGGELFDQIIGCGHFSEASAAHLLRALLGFVAHAHARGVAHRDLKPENIMLSSTAKGAGVKVIDYGTSEFCEPGQRLHEKFGTPYYVAPEVLLKDYDCGADVWSLGVIAYILLCGFPPFGGRSDDRILAKVARGSYSFAAKEWEGVSESAKDLITLMLTVDPNERPSARQLLSHPWLTSPGASVDGSAPAAGAGAGAGAGRAPRGGAAALGAHMVGRLRQFAAMSRVKRLALVCLARTLTDADVTRLRDLFAAMDSADTGAIGAEELQAALEQVGAAIDPDEMRQLMAASDLEGLGRIRYNEFLAAMMDSARVTRKRGAARRSFQQLDRDGDGLLTVDDLAAVLMDEGDPSLRRGAEGRKRSIDMAASIVSEAEGGGKGALTYEDFERAWGGSGGGGGGGGAGAEGAAARGAEA